jgi:hypothetical protein
VDFVGQGVESSGVVTVKKPELIGPKARKSFTVAKS